MVAFTRRELLGSSCMAALSLGGCASLDEAPDWTRPFEGFNGPEGHKALPDRLNGSLDHHILAEKDKLAVGQSLERGIGLQVGWRWEFKESDDSSGLWYEQPIRSGGLDYLGAFLDARDFVYASVDGPVGRVLSKAAWPLLPVRFGLFVQATREETAEAERAGRSPGRALQEGFYAAVAREVLGVIGAVEPLIESTVDPLIGRVLDHTYVEGDTAPDYLKTMYGIDRF